MPSYKFTFTAEVEGLKTEDLAKKVAEATVKALPKTVFAHVEIKNPTVEKVQIISNAD